MSPLPECAVGTQWFHSHEEDTTDVKVFRPRAFAFPRSRGRSGFELRPGGELIYYAIAPADGTDEVEGRWSYAEPRLITLTMDDPHAQSFGMEVLHCDRDILTVRR